MVIKWNKTALKQLENSISFVEQESPANAEKVKISILLKIDSLLKHPEKYSPDKFKIKNDGSFRAFEMYHFRISYRIKGNEIRIFRIRHTRQNPLIF